MDSKRLQEDSQRMLDALGFRPRLPLDEVMAESADGETHPRGACPGKQPAPGGEVLSPQQRLFLSHVVACPHLSTTERSAALELSDSSANAIKSFLVTRGLTTDLDLSQAGRVGRKRLLNPEDAGLRLLGLSLKQYASQGLFLHR